MIMHRLLISAFCAVVLLAHAEDAQLTFERAIKLLESRKYAEAIPILQDVLKTYPQSEGALWNLGISAAEIGNHALAVETWNRYRTNFPSDGQATAKLIQAHQSLGRLSDRDRERQALFSFRNSLPPEDIGKFIFYCRDQFRAGGANIMAYEYFEPKGQRRVFYRFSVLDETGGERFFLSLGSYDSTTQIARELGEISAGERAYHLDKYQGSSHWTYGHFNSLPTYDAIRAMIVDILAGKASPLSGSK